MKQLKYVLMFSVLILLSFVTVNYWQTEAQQNSTRTNSVARLQDGLGKEVRFASPGAGEAEIRDSINSVSQFINNRAGFHVSSAVQERLVAEEKKFLSGESNGILVSTVVPTITTVLLDRAKALTTDEINYVADSLAGLRASDLPQNFVSDTVKLRANMDTGLTKRQLTSFLFQIKNNGLSQTDLFEINSTIADLFNKRVDLYRQAFGNFVASKNNYQYISPSRAYLIYYSIVSDDFLSGSTASYRQTMKSLRAVYTKRAGYYPATDNFVPFGSNGYLYSSPIDLVMDEATTLKMLNALTGTGVN